MQLAGKTECTGCQACFAACPRKCIRMERDAEGFLYPAVDESKCVNCGACEACCPVLHPPALRGGEPAAYAAYVRDMQIREESSSGGVFSELAMEVLAQHGAVFGAVYDQQYTVKHVCIESPGELSKLRGAKYAQSDLGNTLSEVKARLEINQPVLFAGTPCQVAGLKTFLRKNYDNLICVDFVCHGVPSPTAWRQYVKYQADLDGKKNAPQTVNMRAKDSGWSRYSYSYRFEYPDGTVTCISSGKSLFMKLFVGDYLSRQSCSDCRFKGYSRVSDITLGDFWGIWNIAPEMDDNRGTSVVLCHSDRGTQLLNRIADRLVMRQVTLEESSRENPSMLRASPANSKRAEALVSALQGDFASLQSWFIPKKTTSMQKLAGKLRRLRKGWGK